MSENTAPERMLDPIAGEGPFVETGQGQSSPNEITQLLPPSNKPAADDQHGRSKPSHFRDIDESRVWWLLSSVVFAYALSFADSTFMASSHPVITSYFNASNAASWLSTVFYLTSTVFQPLFGRVSDVVGRRPVYLLAITIFGLATAWCGLAQDIGSFIAARTVCGLGAGGVNAMSSILVSDIVRIEYRGLYQSYLNLACAFGNGMGAALGGILCDKLGWRWAFGIQVIPITIFWVLAFFATPTNLGPCLAKSEGKTVTEAIKSFDTSGAVVLTITVTSLIMGINLGGNIFPWTHPIVLTALVLFAIAAVVLVLVERKAKRPMLPIPLLSTIPNANLMWSNLLGTMIVNTVIFNVPLFLQAVRQISPTDSGLILVSPLIGITISAVFSGFYVTWTRRMKPTLVVGAVSLLTGTIATSCLTPSMPMWAILCLIPWASTGQGFLMPSTTIAVLAINPQDEQAVVTTTLGLSRNLGSILGIAISSWVFQNALVVYLKRQVTGDEGTRQQIISEVRKSIKSIAGLDPLHKGEVISAYSNSLRVTFLSGVLFAVAVNFLIIPIRLPRLQSSTQDKPRKDVPAAGSDEGVA